MKTYRIVAGVMLWAVVVGPTALGGGDKDKPKDAPKEESVSPYESKTQ
jgi:hypothetical protein